MPTFPLSTNGEYVAFCTIHISKNDSQMVTPYVLFINVKCHNYPLIHKKSGHGKKSLIFENSPLLSIMNAY